MNILHLAKVEAKTFWKIVKVVRQINSLQTHKFGGDCSKTKILGIDMIRKNNDLLESKTGIKGSSIPVEKVTKETLETAAEMFTHMNLCSDLEELYKYIFLKSSPKNFILALQSIMSKSLNSGKLPEKIWTFITRKLNLTTHDKLRGLIDEISIQNESKTILTLGLTKDGM